MINLGQNLSTYANRSINVERLCQLFWPKSRHFIAVVLKTIQLYLIHYYCLLGFFHGDLYWSRMHVCLAQRAIEQTMKLLGSLLLLVAVKCAEKSFVDQVLILYSIVSLPNILLPSVRSTVTCLSELFYYVDHWGREPESAAYADILLEIDGTLFRSKILGLNSHYFPF